jgi:hypothetical protein
VIMDSMQTDNGPVGAGKAAAVPRPRAFPLKGAAPGPRCGHTLTTIVGQDNDVGKAKLVLFGGAHVCVMAGTGVGTALIPACMHTRGRHRAGGLVAKEPRWHPRQLARPFHLG